MKILGISGHKQSGKSTLAEFIKAWYEVDNSEDSSKFKINDSGQIIWTKGSVDNFEKVKVYSFADSLKDFCVDTLGLDYYQCWGSDEEKNTETPYLWNNLPLNIRSKYGKREKKKEAFGFGSGSVDIIPKSGNMTAREVMQVFGTEIAREMFDQNIWVNATLRKIHKEGYPLAIISDVRFPSEVKAIMENGGNIIRLTRTYDSSDQHSSETALNNYNWKQYGDRIKFIDNNSKTIYQKNDIALNFLKSIMCGV